MIDIIVHDSKNIPKISDTVLKHLKTIILSILDDFNVKKRYCSITICDNSFIQTLNKEYRNKDIATDVLSFSLDDNEEFILPTSSLGDIIISAETAFMQSQEYQISYNEELMRLTIHGLLHLLGFDHEISSIEHQKMFVLQDKYMDQFMQKFYHKKSSLI